MYQIYHNYIRFNGTPVARINGREVEFLPNAENVSGFSFCEVTAFLDRVKRHWYQKETEDGHMTFQKLQQFLNSHHEPLVSA